MVLYPTLDLSYTRVRMVDADAGANAFSNVIALPLLVILTILQLARCSNCQHMVNIFHHQIFTFAP